MEMNFLDQKLWLRIYTIKKAFLTIKRVELVGKKEFTAATLDPEVETFVIHVMSFNSISLPSSSPLNVHLFCKAQIAGLVAEKALLKVPDKYVNFVNIFSPDLLSKLPKYTEINNHFIELLNANGFIKPSKSFADAPIFFDQNKGLNNFTIINRYILSQVGKLLDRLEKTK